LPGLEREVETMMLNDLLSEVCTPDRTPETASFASVSVYIYRNTAFGEQYLPVTHIS
jgi:hypothetical protein